MAKNPLKVIEVVTDTCGQCKMIAPMVDKVVEMQGTRIDFERRVVKWDDEIVEKYNIMQAPTFLFMDGDKLLHKHTGAVTIPSLNKMITDNIAKLPDIDE